MTVSKKRSSVSARDVEFPQVTIESAKGFSLVDAIRKYLEKALRDAGVKMNGKDSKKNSDGSTTYKLTFMYTPDGAEESVEIEFYVNGKPTDKNKEYVDLSFMYPDFKTDKSGKTLKKDIDKYTNVPNKTKDILKKCQQLIDEVFGVDTIEDVPDSLEASELITSSEKMMKFTMKKTKSSVTGSQYKIELRNIFANYSPVEALADINTIAGDDTFINQLEYDSPIMYGVAVLDDGYDVETLKGLDDNEFEQDYKAVAYDAILNQAYKFYFDCKHVYYTACGRDMSKIQSYVENYIWRLQEIIDTISKLVVADKLTLLHPIDRIRCSDCIDYVAEENQLNFWDDFTKSMSYNIKDMVDVLTLYASNLSKEDESVVLSWIRTWKYDLTYILERSSY